jgi:hypothetical protein
MGQIRADHHPFAAADTPSFHDLLDRVTADEQLDPRRKADLRSAIKSLGQWLGSDLTAMPAHPRYLRGRLAGFQPAVAGVSRKRLQNVRSTIAFALDRYGLGGRRSYLAPLSPAAQALYDRWNSSSTAPTASPMPTSLRSPTPYAPCAPEPRRCSAADPSGSRRCAATAA